MSRKKDTQQQFKYKSDAAKIIDYTRRSSSKNFQSYNEQLEMNVATHYPRQNTGSRVVDIKSK